MKKPAETDFIVIDDEPMSNRICEIVITRIFSESDLQTFTDPVKAFEHISYTYARAGAHNAIIFLDLKMPVMDGWAVLERIKDLQEEVKKHLNIYILSSSTDQRDVKRANENPLVKKFIRKPLLINSLRQQLSNADFL